MALGWKKGGFSPAKRAVCLEALGRGATVGLETLAWERGVTGVEEEVVKGGKVVGTTRKRSDSVFKMLLEGGTTGRYGPQVKALREQIEKELRPKIEAEIRAEQAASKPDRMAQRREFEAMLSDFNRRMGGEG